jgi:protein-tyrosine phosphatase
MRPSVLFVCLGNICRSPLAEGAFRHEARAIGLEVVADSAGTGGWHAGEPPDPRAIAAARRQGVDIAGQRARQVKAEDFRRFDLVLALDHDNLRNLRALMPKDATAQLGLLLDHAPGLEGQAVADPYYGDDAGFDLAWEQVSQAAHDLARRLRHGEI